MFSKNVILL